MEPWKKAQEDVKKEFNKITRKDFLFKPFADTYSAGGKAIMPDQPSDFWVLDNGRYYVVEVKSCHQPKFYYKDCRPSQMIAARRVPAAGGISIFLITKLPENKWHIVLGSAMHEHKAAGNPGILWSQMQPCELNWESIKQCISSLSQIIL